MLKNYKELNVWQKSYILCLHIYWILDSLTPEPFLPDNWEKIHTKKLPVPHGRAVKGVTYVTFQTICSHSIISCIFSSW